MMWTRALLLLVVSATCAAEGCARRCENLLDCPSGQVCDRTGICIDDVRPPPVPVGEGEGEGEGEGGEGEGEGEGGSGPAGALDIPVDETLVYLVGRDLTGSSQVAIEGFLDGRESAGGFVFPRNMWIGPDGNIAYLEVGDQTVARVFVPDESAAELEDPHANDIELDTNGCTNLGQLVYLSTSRYFYRCGSEGWFTGSGTSMELSSGGNFRSVSGSFGFFVEGSSASVVNMTSFEKTPIEDYPLATSELYSVRRSSSGFIVLGHDAAESNGDYHLYTVSTGGNMSLVRSLSTPSGFSDRGAAPFNTVVIGPDEASIFAIGDMDGDAAVVHIRSQGSSAVYFENESPAPRVSATQDPGMNPVLITGGSGY